MYISKQWLCKVCNAAANAKSRKICWKCGAKKDKSEVRK